MYLIQGLQARNQKDFGKFVILRQQNESSFLVGNLIDCLSSYTFLIDNFSNMFGFTFDKFDPHNVEMFNAMIGKIAIDMKSVEGEVRLRTLSLVAIFAATSYIIPDAYNTLEIVSNAAAIEHMFHRFNAYTGTLCGMELLPIGSKVLTDAGGLGKIHERLLRARYQLNLAQIDPCYDLITMHTFFELMDSILEQAYEKDSTILERVRVIIDEFAHFKSNKRKEIATFILKYFVSQGTIYQTKGIPVPLIKGVIYFDDQNNKPAFLNSQLTVTILPSTRMDVIMSMTGHTPDEIFSYYDPSHIVGIDITQMNDAVALLFVNYKTAISNCLQATMRMRKFFSLQEIFFVLSSINLSQTEQQDDDLNFPSLLLHFIKNEDNAYANHFLTIGPQKLTALSRAIVFENGLIPLADDDTIFYHRIRIDILGIPFHTRMPVFDCIKTIAKAYIQHLKDSYGIYNVEYRFNEVVGLFNPDNRARNYYHLYEESVFNLIRQHSQLEIQGREEGFRNETGKVSIGSKIPALFRNETGKVSIGSKIPALFRVSVPGDDKIELEDSNAQKEQETEVEVEVQVEVQKEKEIPFPKVTPAKIWTAFDPSNLIGQISKSISSTNPFKGFYLFANHFFCLQQIINSNPNLKLAFGKLRNLSNIFVSINFLLTDVYTGISLLDKIQKIATHYLVYQGNAYILASEDLGTYMLWKGTNSNSEIHLCDVSWPTLDRPNASFPVDAFTDENVKLHYSIMSLNAAPILMDIMFD